MRSQHITQFKFMRERVETPIQRPQFGAFSQGGSSQQVRVDMADAARTIRRTLKGINARGRVADSPTG
jgi:hypothetical protein